MNPSVDPGPLPADGSIETFSTADSVGSIRTDDGRTFRFGQSGCKGFSAVVGLRVRVTEAAKHFAGGFKATRVELPASQEGAYRTLLQQRDEAAGIKPPTLEMQVATAKRVGWISVLLDDPQAALALAGVRWLGERAVSLRFGSLDVHAEITLAPFPKDDIDLRPLPPGFDLGRAFVTLCFGLPGVGRAMREAQIDRRDQWDADGIARNVSRAAEVLLRAGRGVIVHRAQNRAYTREQFLGLLGDPNDVTKKPFRPWVVLGVDPERTRVLTSGMEVFGLPDVHAPIGDSRSQWHLDRAIEAALVFAHTMIAQNRLLRAGEVITVPVDVSVGASPLVVPPDAELHPWRVIDDRGDLMLERTDGSLDPAARWARGGLALSLASYAELYSPRLAEESGATSVATWTPREPRVAHDIEVFSLGRAGFLVSTVGLARVEPRIEFLARTMEHGPRVCAIVSAIAGWLGPFSHGDKIAFDNDLGVTRFVLATRGSLSLGPGPEVRLAEIIPVEPETYLSLDRDRAIALIDALDHDRALAAAHAGIWSRALR